jgi:hypothetical protein
MRVSQSQYRIPLFVTAGMLVGFLAGFAWQHFQGAATRASLDRAEHELVFLRLEATLGAAAVEAGRGGYETARQRASEFFTGLQQEIGHAPEQARPALSEILDRRDAMITALSRNDPQSAPLLAQLVLRFRSAFGRPVGPGDGTLPAPTTAPADSPAAQVVPATHAGSLWVMAV